MKVGSRADSPEPSRPRSSGDDPVVRARVVWCGVAIAILGMLVVGAGMVLGRPLVAIAGAALVLAGLLVSWRGGILYDVHTTTPISHEATEVLNPEQHQGIVPGAVVDSRAARRIAAEGTQHKHQRLLAATGAHAPRRPLAATGMMFLGVWLLIGQWMLVYPISELGQSIAVRDTGFSIVVTLVGLRLRLTRTSRLSTGLGLLCGVALVLCALLLPHSATRTTANELVSGLLVLAASAATIQGSRGATL